MTHHICAEDGSVGEGIRLILTVKSDLDQHGLGQAVRDAVAEFVSSGTRRAEDCLDATCGNFNWGDLYLWLPEDIQKAHGFEILSADTTDFITCHNESLLPEGFEYDVQKGGCHA